MSPSSVHFFVIFLIAVADVFGQTAVNKTGVICDSTDLLLCDMDNVLTQEKSNQLEVSINEVNNGSVCVCNNCTNQQGYVIAVAIVSALDSEDDGLTYAENLRHEWLFSRTSCDDSILLLYSYNDGKVFIVMGHPLEKRISNSTIDEIHKECDAVDSVVECLEQAVEKLDKVITEIIKDEAIPDDNLVWGILGFVTIVTILGFHYYIKY